MMSASASQNKSLLLFFSWVFDSVKEQVVVYLFLIHVFNLVQVVRSFFFSLIVFVVWVVSVKPVVVVAVPHNKIKVTTLPHQAWTSQGSNILGMCGESGNLKTLAVLPLTYLFQVWIPPINTM